MRLFCGLSLLSLIACNEPDFTAAKTAFGACSQTAECERNGTVCAEGVCVTPGFDWDGGAPVDVGPSVDASVSADAQDLIDAGITIDSGLNVDAGLTDDAGLSDSGAVADVGVGDAGDENDAGVAPVRLCSDGSTEGGFEVFGRRDIALCTSEDNTMPTSKALAETLCGPGATLCSAEQYRARNDSCSDELGYFSGWLSDGADCVVRTREFEGSSCSTDGTLHVQPGSCPVVRDLGNWSLEAYTVDELRGANCNGLGCGALCCAVSDGSHQLNAARTCSTLHDDYPNLESGIYWIDPDGDGGTQAFQVECDMTTAGGGWTTTKKWGSGQNYQHRDFLTQTNPMGLVSQSQGDINESTYSIRSFGDLLSSNQVKIHWQFDTQEYVHQTEGFVVFAAGPVEFNPNAENETPAGWWTGSGWRGNPDLPFQQAIREAPIAESQPRSQDGFAEVYNSYAFGEFDRNTGAYCASNNEETWTRRSDNNSVRILCSDYDDGQIWVSFRHASSPDGSSAEQAAHTCSTLHDDYPNLESGIYWIDPDGDGGTQAYRARCDMDTLGGGWTIVKRWGSGANYSNSLFMSNTNSMGRSASEQGSVEDSTYAVPYEGALDEANEVLLGWEFTQQNEVEHATGYVYWDASLNDFNPGADTMDSCSNQGFWTRRQGGCEYSNGDASVLGQSHIFTMSSWLIGDLEGTNTDWCSSRAWDDEAGLTIPNPGGEPSGNIQCPNYDNGHIWIAARRLVGPDGSGAEQAGLSCKAIKDDHPNSPSAAYWLDPDGEGEAPAYQVWCDMEYNGGGWQLVTIISNANNQILGNGNYFPFVAGQHVTASPDDTDALGSVPVTQPFREIMIRIQDRPGWHMRYVADSVADVHSSIKQHYADLLEHDEAGITLGDRTRWEFYAKASPEADEIGLGHPTLEGFNCNSRNVSAERRFPLACNTGRLAGELRAYDRVRNESAHHVENIPNGTSFTSTDKLVLWVR